MDRTLVAWLLIAVLAAPLVYGVSTLAADTSVPGSTTGVIRIQATAPTVSFALYSDSAYTTTTTQITPQTPVYMKIDVTGSNPLEQLTLTVELYTGTTANTSDAPPATTTSPENYVKFTITYNGAAWVLSPDTGGSTTWSIQIDGAQPQPDPLATSGSFYIVIVFGKTAYEANTGDNAPAVEWEIKVNATMGSGDLAATTIVWADQYTVFFYGEVSVGATTVTFGPVQAGGSSTITSVDGVNANSFTVTVIANGFYDLKATADASWLDANGREMLLTTGTPGNFQFQLLIDDQQDAANPGTPLSPVPVDTLVDTAQAFVDDAVDATGPTTEAGVQHTIYMQVNIGPVAYSGEFTGAIQIYAVDGS